MAEKVQTGGNVAFHYDSKYQPKLKDAEKKEIDEAYEKYYERKKSERKRKNLLIVIIILIILILAGLVLYLLK